MQRETSRATRQRGSVWDEADRRARNFAVPFHREMLFTDRTLELLVELRVSFLEVIQVALHIQRYLADLSDPDDVSYVLHELSKRIPALDYEYEELECIAEDALRFLQHFDRYIPAASMTCLAHGKTAKVVGIYGDALVISLELAHS